MDAPDELAICHPILKAALQAASPEEWPQGPYSLGGPKPVCPAVAQVELGLWFASLVSPYLTSAAERSEAKRVLAGVRESLAEPRRLTADEVFGHSNGMKLRSFVGRVHNRLIADSTSVRGESQALAVVRRTAGAAAAVIRVKDTLPHIGPAVTRVVRLLKEAGDAAPMTVHDFLAELDARILRLECAAAIAPLLAGAPMPEVADVLWRGDGGKGQALHFIARMGDGRLGLVTKIGRRWAWVHGGRDEVLASVPDERFAEATRAVMKDV